MSSVDFSGFIWSWELSADSVFEEVIIWILVVLSMVVLSSLTIYHFYRLFPEPFIHQTTKTKYLRFVLNTKQH